MKTYFQVCLKNKGDSMIKKIFLTTALTLITNVQLFSDEQLNRDKYLTDTNYINGMLYLEGKKGINTIIKEISNCPYEKCRKSDVSDSAIAGTVKIEVDKPDFKKAIEYLSQSVEDGNFLAADKLVLFLIKRIDYKSKYPDQFILDLLKEDTGLSFEQYKQLIKKAVTVGSNSKGCASSYYYGDFILNGYFDFPAIKEQAKEYFEIAKSNCPKDNFFYMMANSKGK
jgi:hypothetical protein